MGAHSVVAALWETCMCKAVLRSAALHAHTTGWLPLADTLASLTSLPLLPVILSFLLLQAVQMTYTLGGTMQTVSRSL